VDLILTVFLLLLLVAISGVTVRFLPQLPLPLLQVGMGALAALPGIGLRVDFDPRLFLLLFVPPLLFVDGWRVSKREFFRLRGPILTLALGLVLFTVIGAGYLVHWTIPAIPLSAAFALAAVLSPTDAVAVSAVARRIKVPPRLMHVLEGESLLNDASGLVAMKFAITATLTGSFSLLEATRSFFVIALGGLAVGVAVAWLFGWVQDKLISWRGEELSLQLVLLRLLLPFGVYLLAEHLAVSGILAVVAAGVTVDLTDLRRSGNLAGRMQARELRTMIEFVFNGLIFLLLGLQLPQFIGEPLRGAYQSIDPGETWQLMGLTAALWLALLALRFVWIWGALCVSAHWAKWRGEPRNVPSLRYMGAATLAGIRGAVTLAGVLSVPLAMPDGSPFPARDLLIFLASGVILFSLFGGCFGLPIVLRGLQLPPEDLREREEREARTLAAAAAIGALEGAQQPADGSNPALYLEVLGHVTAHYRLRTEDPRGTETDPLQGARAASFERGLWLTGLRAERAELYRLRSTSRINDDTLRSLVREIDLIEASIERR
jgi:Na+/H+ antiporter